MERVASSRDNNHIEGSEATQATPIYASVLNGSLKPCPPEDVQVSIFSYTWRDFKPGSPVTERKDTMCTKYATWVGRAYVQLATCFKFNGENIMPQEDMDILQYSWYRRAAVCLVYLKDVQYTDSGPEMKNRLRTSQWLREPWALQELLASQQIYFYSQEGTYFQETKSSLLDWFEQETAIEKSILQHPQNVENACIAKRMSWAATRIYDTPDAVHSLKGIFNVSMASKRDKSTRDAFHRLQIELIKKYSRDLSIFAWKVDHQNGPLSHNILLADSPREFASCSRLELCEIQLPVSQVSRGDENIYLNIPLRHMGNIYNMLYLNCYEPDELLAIGIQIIIMPETQSVRRFDVTETKRWYKNPESANIRSRRFVIKPSGEVTIERN
ncbi:hypothetical protein ANOM_002082 [Aspergillus nomiae NRRL 13137]|uniref:Heterokaryon incompatibility domain-containing protein n=1 Tax=Aspergillus nomiae NRRL (strain ATCC 15546 / NRRL 13137 / CBS 260.88 / M93) TaxID=1509407 RepID=A0A0L1JE84_ASPN3|nr:uncharacterized protein ANOM_002082 [Aspergillus nomiae NRRL 13137]KNG90114.1 hypothetical protein ANOM_002082 [Aspergillus nomiae NRRL 13137]